MYLVLIVVAWMYIPSVDCLDCYSCLKVDNITSCQTMATCQNNENCYTETNLSGNQLFYQLGCRPQDQCLKTVTQSPAIVGRSVGDQNNCSICCSLDGCNRDLCGGFDNQLVNTKEPCLDDPNFDCEKFGPLLNVCGDVQKASSICKKYCGLCDLVTVDGAWTSWGSWGNCDVTCGPGHLTRTRACTNPAPVHGGSICVGSVNESTSCNLKACPIDGTLSDWSSWTRCSAICGDGKQFRTRHCQFPTGVPHGNDCTGNFREQRDCKQQVCPIDGHWSDWSTYTSCSATCGGGTRTRHRTCVFDYHAPHGAQCFGNATQKEDCNTDVCPVDGTLSDWSSWTRCSAICGDGKQFRTRHCQFPTGVPHGNDCTGNFREQRDCKQQVCPIDGHWSDWSTYTSCSATCGGGTRTRHRTCVFDYHAPHGAQCFGNATQKEDCNTDVCPVDGILTDWSSWTRCTAICGDGKQFRTRHCQFPSGVPHGNGCTGNFREQQDCKQQVCPINGIWSDWAAWTTCSTTCNVGIQSRTRTCQYDAVAPHGATCPGGQTQDSQSCNEKNLCPVNGAWSAWTDWSTCSTSCGAGTGTMDSTRQCTFPIPGAPHGNDCTGVSLKQMPCSNNAECPVDGVWHSWQYWHYCSSTCGNGTKTRVRECYFPPSASHGNDCAGEATDSATCNERACPADGQWASWKVWHGCSATCGGGTGTRTRDCQFPPNVALGQYCPGSSYESGTCNDQACPCKWEGYQLFVERVCVLKYVVYNEHGKSG